MIIRKPTEEDAPRLQEWIDRDPYHKGQFRPEFFMGALSMVFEDEVGPVCYLKLMPHADRSVRVFMQFDTGKALRTARMMKQGFPIVKYRAEMAKATKLIFDSVHEPLIEFCKNRFGFQAVPESHDLQLSL